jgi:hypothetical protein
MLLNSSRRPAKTHPKNSVPMKTLFQLRKENNDDDAAGTACYRDIWVRKRKHKGKVCVWCGVVIIASVLKWL